MKKKKNFTLGKDWTTQFQLHTLMLPGTVCIIVFMYSAFVWTDFGI